MPLLEQNISANAQYYTSTSPHALVLDWDDEELSEDVKNLGELDAIMYVCFENVDCNLTFIIWAEWRMLHTTRHHSLLSLERCYDFLGWVHNLLRYF